jgi:hypothetical protein
VNTPNADLDPVDKALAECKKYAGKTTDLTLRFFINNYFIPTLSEMREEYLAVVEEDDEDGGDEAFATMAINLVQTLSSLLDASFKAAGWMNETDVTDKIPAEIKVLYSSAREDLAEFGEASKELYSVVAEGDDEDDDGEDDEDEGGAVITLVTPPAGGAA